MIKQCKIGYCVAVLLCAIAVLPFELRGGISFPGNVKITVPWDGVVLTNKSASKIYSDGVERAFYYWEYVEKDVLVDDVVSQFYDKENELRSKMFECEIADKFADNNVSRWSSWVFPYVMKRVIERQNYCATSQVFCVAATTNVHVHYVFNSVQPSVALPQTNSCGFVNVITEVLSGGAVGVPESWASNYPLFKNRYGDDFVKALMKPTGKRDGAGNLMLVWQDYVAGTDPTDTTSTFTASVTMVNNSPVVSWSPELSDEEAQKRKYVIWGKKQLQDANWTEVSAGSESTYNFFKVSVEML